MDHPFEEFRRRRARGNAMMLDTDNLAIKRFFGLDKTVFGPASLDTRTKELLGLVASLVLRCNDCIDYHLERCVAEDWSADEVEDAMAVALIVGGSIVIPHARHASKSMEFLLSEEASN